MSKKLIIAEIAERTGLSQAAVQKVIHCLGDVVTKNLSQGYDVTLPDIGKLKAVHAPARSGRNPRTGEAVPIPATRKVKFSVAAPLKQAVAI
jgi:DNA-binding protein HU-beta